MLLAERAASPFAGRYTLPAGWSSRARAWRTPRSARCAKRSAWRPRSSASTAHVEVIERDGEGRVRHHYVIASFVGAWVAGEDTPGPEAAAVVWADRDEAARLPTTEHLPELLEAAWAIFERSVSARLLLPPAGVGGPAKRGRMREVG